MKAALPFLALALIGAAWGATQPLAKIAVSDGYRHVGILFWQNGIIAVFLGAICLLRGRGLPLTGGALQRYFVISLIGTVLPGIASYSAAVHLPSGVLSILLSAVPMLAFPVALMMGNDNFALRRLLGLALGFCGVMLLVLPQEGLPASVSSFWVAIALLASACYAIEGNYVARYGTAGLDPMQVLTGASIIGMGLTGPAALWMGQFIIPGANWSAPDSAIVASSLLHGLAYAGYVGLVGWAGSVFAVQVAYLVTLFGVTWAILLLGESYSGWFWAAFVTMLAGMALVQPRPKQLVPDQDAGQNRPK
ncbi:DMT family transporter [Thalassococcus lentus]|uniref:DMT family transporter n=1 Tax=Thalassococcus lentus TaxID=1210524 RepID=A0ABT4XSN6_9RHOB|nr:DMT family transporter [Thalassococcus lentus]MDA7424858.1 DMT family transporter [Thalassococcus lentus]